MTYKVTMRNNETGEVRDFEQDLEWHDSSHFWWTEGNYGCDCNRYLVWNDYPDEDDDTPCGHTLFTVLHATFPDGKVIEIDPPDTAKGAVKSG